MALEEQLAQGRKGLGEGTERRPSVQPEKGRSQPVAPALPVPTPTTGTQCPILWAAWVRAVSRQGDTKLDGVKITCRYTFNKNSNRVGIKFIYRKDPKISCRINSSINPAWYYTNPFDRIIFKGKSEPFQVQSGKKLRFWDSTQPVTLAGKKVFFRLKSPRVIARLLPGSVYSCMLNGGFWQYDWKEGTLLERDAVIEFGSVRNGTLQE